MQLNDDTSERLSAEIERYLRAVDAFRGEGCEPLWRPERPPARTPSRRERRC